MRNTGPMTQYNRYVAMHRHPPDAPNLDKTMLGTFAAAESLSIMAFVKWCKGDATTYAAK